MSATRSTGPVRGVSPLPRPMQGPLTIQGRSLGLSKHSLSGHTLPHSYLTYIKLSTTIKRNENMARGLQRALLQPQPEDDSKRSPRPQDLIRLYDIILQVPGDRGDGLCVCGGGGGY